MIKKHKKGFTTALIIFLLVIMASIVGMAKIKVSNFNPINGDWQNYNPIRRLLAGQVPYHDFVVYLGLGHLYFLSFIQLLIGNNFTNSMFASYACTFLMFELVLYVVSYLILKDKRKALYFTLAGAIVNLYRPRIITSNLSAELISGLDFAKSPMNSARLIRNAAFIISPLLIMLLVRIIDNSSKIKDANKKNLLKKIMIAIIGGASIPWSNDGGIATYIAISFVYFLLLIKEHKKNIKLIIRDTFMYILISLFSLFIIILIVTRGDVLSWFKYTLGVSSYQKWYYGTEIYVKNNVCLTDIYFSITNVSMILLSIIYLYMIFKSKDKDETLRYALLGIITISVILSSYLYQIISGGIAIEILSLVMLIIMFSYITKFGIELINKNSKNLNKYIAYTIIILALAVSISEGWKASVDLVKRSSKVPEYVYIEELGGYFSELGDSIVYAKNRIGNEKIFSTYSSAVEAATNQFQPTGSDYIIHALGDEQREKYMQVFNNWDGKYVTTINCDYSPYCGWEKNANWFFFKELYTKYKPSFITEYNIYWEKRNNSNQDIKAEILIDKQNDSYDKIIVKTENKTFDGIASVKLSYNTKLLRSFWKSFDYNKYVYVQDITGEEVLESNRINYFIPQSIDEYYVPVTIKNGYGEIRLLSVPQDNTKLTITDAKIDNISTAYFDYAVSANKNPEGNILYLKNKEENRMILEDAVSIIIDNVKANIVALTLSIIIDNVKANIVALTLNNDYIVLELDRSAKPFAYPNYFEVVK